MAMAELADDSRRLVTVKYAADLLGVSRSKIYKLHYAGKLDLVKMDARTRVTLKSLNDYLASLQRIPDGRKPPATKEEGNGQ